MLIDINEELREFTYISNLYKCVSNYHRKGHMIGRKIGDMLEILTLGAIYKNPKLHKHLAIETKVEGYTKAEHKVEYLLFNNLRKKEGLFGAIECKCVGVEKTAMNKKHINLRFGLTHPITFKERWQKKEITFTIKIVSINSDSVNFKVSNTCNSNVQSIEMHVDDELNLVVDEHENVYAITSKDNMLAEIAGIIRSIRIVRLTKIHSNSCDLSFYYCLTGPQTIEKAKQASFVAMDLRKKIDASWGKEGVNTRHRKTSFVLVLCEFSHWEPKSKKVISSCIDHNIIVPDCVLIKSFEIFEQRFKTRMFDCISKTEFKKNKKVQEAIYDVIEHFDNQVFYDLESKKFVEFSYNNNVLCLNAL